MSISYFIIATLLWLLLAALRSMKLAVGNISQFELERRANQHDPHALKELERSRQLPNVYALRYVIETTVFIVLIALLVGGYGLINGIALTLIALLLLPPVSRLPVLASVGQGLYKKYENSFLQFATNYQPLLRWLQSQQVTPELQIHSKEEFFHLAKNTNNIFTKDELLLFEHGLAFSKKSVQEIMTPQSVIEYTEENETVGPVVLDRLHKTGHSRFPVIKGDINHIVGMLYMHDLVPLDRTLKTVKKAMHSEVFYIRNDQTLEHALHAFLRTHHHLFIVVNEYRETVGLLSLEDTIEALLGRKIIDEFDAFHDLRSVATTNPRKNNQPSKHEDV